MKEGEPIATTLQTDHRGKPTRLLLDSREELEQLLAERDTTTPSPTAALNAIRKARKEGNR